MHTLHGSYVCDESGKVLQYKLNGFRVLLLLVAIYFWQFKEGSIDARILYHNYWNVVAASFNVGMALSIFFFIRGLTSTSPVMRMNSY